MSLIDHISITTGYTGYRGLRFLHEINTFPSFYVHAQAESRKHDGAGSKLAIITLDVRGYGWSEGLSYIEQIVRDLEHAIQQYAALHANLVHEARVISLRTDENVMEPYCICDMSVEILYGITND
jgi:hypothetical protein